MIVIKVNAEEEFCLFSHLFFLLSTLFSYPPYPPEEVRER